MRIFRWAGLVGAVVFLVGHIMVSSVPGGGEVDSADFTDYYVDDDKTALAIVGLIILSVGVIILVLFLHHLRTMIASDLSRLAFGAGMTGLAVIAGGATLLAGPSAAQSFGDAEFVGEEVAHTFAAAGFGAILIPGALLMGLAIAAFSIAGRQTGMFPSWVTIIGYIVAVLQLAAIIWIPFLVVPVWFALASIAGTRPRNVVSTLV